MTKKLSSEEKTVVKKSVTKKVIAKKTTPKKVVAKKSKTKAMPKKNASNLKKKTLNSNVYLRGHLTKKF